MDNIDKKILSMVDDDHAFEDETNSSRSGKLRPRIWRVRSLWFEDKKNQVDPESHDHAFEELEDKKNSSRSGKSKAGRTNSSKTATSFREDFISGVLWRTFSIGK